MRRRRGRDIAMIFQEPMTSLNPVLTIGTQLIETIQEHLEFDLARARQRSIELLAAVGIPAPEQRLTQYPHQLSGGMRQRVAIAVALSCEPQLLIADEPTTALDVTVQAQILRLLDELQRELELTYIFISHDLAVVNQISDTVSVLSHGTQVESGPTAQVFAHPETEYTRQLIDAIPGSRYRAGDLNLGL